MKKVLLSALVYCLLTAGVFAQADLPGNHLVVLISDTWGARFRGDSPVDILWSIHQGYDFGISSDEILLYNARARFMGKLNIDRRDTGISMLRQTCLIYLPDDTPVTYAVTFFVDETVPSPGASPRGYCAIRLDVRSSNIDYIEKKFKLLVDEVNREFTAPILPVSGRTGSYYQWGSVPSFWRQWPLELYYQETVQQEGIITYYHFSQLGQLPGERNHRYSVQTIYNWIINAR
jgi:hypothetical protein